MANTLSNNSDENEIRDECYPFRKWDQEAEDAYKRAEIERLLKDMSSGRHSKTFYRDDVINQILSVLISMDKPNALLVGPAGCGKTNIAEEIACLIADGDPKIPEALSGYRICALNLSDIVSGSGLLGEIERKISGVIEYVEDPANKAILFLDEIHILFAGESYKKVAQILKPGLSRGRMKVIAATTTQEVKKIDADPAFNRRFTRIVVDELTREQTVNIVKDFLPVMGAHYGVRVDDSQDVAKMIVKTADEFSFTGSHRPDNALTLLDRTISGQVVTNRSKRLRLTKEMVENTAYCISSGNSRIRRLDEKALKKELSRIRGQEDIINDIVNVLKLYDLHIRPRVRPITFLFAGPSGTGKSEIAKILARTYYDEKPIILNMAEYKDSASINRIIGAPAGYAGCDSNNELPFDRLDSNPYQLILLDEFEKCDRSVQRLFMSAFDEGVMKTSSGKEIDFSKSMIIATTNACCTDRVSGIGFSHGRTEQLTVKELAEFFDVELINRFTHRYTFHGIERDVYKDIVKDLYIREMAELDLTSILDTGGLVIEPREDVIDELVERTYDPSLGARPVQDAVTEYIDSMILQIMSNECGSINKEKKRNCRVSRVYRYEEAG